MEKNELDTKSLIIVAIVILFVAAFLYYIFTYNFGVHTKSISTDTLLDKRVDSHEVRLNHIDSLHVKIIHEK
jgi:hypothetical protein